MLRLLALDTGVAPAVWGLVSAIDAAVSLPALPLILFRTLPPTSVAPAAPPSRTATGSVHAHVNINRYNWEETTDDFLMSAFLCYRQYDVLESLLCRTGGGSLFSLQGMCARNERNGLNHCYCTSLELVVSGLLNKTCSVV